jgi:putative transposase
MYVLVFLCLTTREVIVTESTLNPNSTWVCEKTKDDIKPNALPITAPNLNGRCERFIETIKLECLNKFLVFGKGHLDYLVSEFTDYYNHHRSHSARDHLPPVRKEPEEVVSLKMSDVQTTKHLGGLVTSFERKAA